MVEQLKTAHGNPKFLPRYSSPAGRPAWAQSFGSPLEGKMTVSPNIAGAWLMHHDQKLSAVKSTEFESIAIAGRAARLLSYLSKEVQWSVPTERVLVLAQANGIRRHEVPGLLSELQTAGVIDQGANGISVLGVRQANLFHHANAIFEGQNPSNIERAALELAERASDRPVEERAVAAELGDLHRLSAAERSDLVNLSKQIGFVDHELARDQTLLFNGSLFKRENAEKSRIILEGLSDAERQNLLDVEDRLTRSGCLPEDTITNILGAVLWSKLHQIGYFQVSMVTNERGSTRFVTKPAALVKYVPGGLADMHDDAKALASSLTYGILKSNSVRGQITMPDKLMGALINRGYVEGWAEAIKQDYQTLERRGVVQVTSSSRGNRLTLYKPEVGEMARELILRGDASEAAAKATFGTQAGQFVGPEQARQMARSPEKLKVIPETAHATSRALDSLRKTR
jgi:hypothetical protein